MTDGGCQSVEPFGRSRVFGSAPESGPFQVKRSPRSAVRASLRTMVVCFEKSLVIECISGGVRFC